MVVTLLAGVMGMVIRGGDYSSSVLGAFFSLRGWCGCTLVSLPVRRCREEPVHNSCPARRGLSNSCWWLRYDEAKQPLLSICMPLLPGLRSRVSLRSLPGGG